MFCRRLTNALLCFFCCFTTVFVTASTEAQVAINEIFYNAPDDLDDHMSMRRAFVQEQLKKSKSSK